MSINIKLFLVTFFWGSSYVINKLVLYEIPPFTVAFVRLLLVAVILSFFYYTSGNITSDLNTLKKNTLTIFYLILIAVFGLLLHNVFFYWGLKYIDAGLTSILIEIGIPLFQFLMSIIILQEKISIGKIIAFFTAALGLIIVSFQSLTKVYFAQSTFYGVVLVLFSAFSYTFSPIYNKKVIEKISILGSLTITSIASVMLISIFAVSENGFSKLISASIYFWIMMLYLAVFCTCLSMFWVLQGIKQFGPARIGAYNFMVPIWGLLLTSLFLGENVDSIQIIGAVIAILSAIYITIGKEKIINKKEVTK